MHVIHSCELRIWTRWGSHGLTLEFWFRSSYCGVCCGKGWLWTLKSVLREKMKETVWGGQWLRGPGGDRPILAPRETVRRSEAGHAEGEELEDGTEWGQAGRQNTAGQSSHCGQPRGRVSAVSGWTVRWPWEWNKDKGKRGVSRTRTEVGVRCQGIS